MLLKRALVAAVIAVLGCGVLYFLLMLLAGTLGMTAPGFAELLLALTVAAFGGWWVTGRIPALRSPAERSDADRPVTG